MVEKSSQIVLNALSRAVADPLGLQLYGTRSVPGLFPTTASGKLAAQRCQEEGFLQEVSNLAGERPAWAVTERGLEHLLGHLSPRQVLEDFVRAVEARQAQLDDLVASARRLQATLDALKGTVDKVLPTLPAAARTGDGPLAALFRSFVNPASPPTPTKADEVVVQQLEHWKQSGASEDCPLPELFRRVGSACSGLSLGAFHDALRRLHDAGRVYLHPWPGPLYDVPEPPYALLVGHVVAYYASTRNG